MERESTPSQLVAGQAAQVWIFRIEHNRALLTRIRGQCVGVFGEYVRAKGSSTVVLYTLVIAFESNGWRDKHGPLCSMLKRVGE